MHLATDTTETKPKQKYVPFHPVADEIVLFQFCFSTLAFAYFLTA